ncbi:MAG: hypothetical protein JWM58_2111 [Rhizobium sp.]|nr:hypothetical protein [Rhizobium sp.]
MLILSLTYIAPLEKADEQMNAHMEWVKKGYDDGLFIASGRKVPRTGGLILARGERAAMDAFCATDPFVVHGIAQYDITEVAFTTVAPGAEILKA